MALKRDATQVCRGLGEWGHLQGCSFVFSCGGLSPHNLGYERPKILYLIEKVCQIRGKIVKLKDFDGT